MILECTQEGADIKVCPALAHRIVQESPQTRRVVGNLEVLTVPLRQKQMLIQQCGKTARQLFNDGCVRVLIIWDLFPSWREGEDPCRHEDKERICGSLDSSGVPRDRVHLVCIREELEAWLIADERALSQVVSTRTHKGEVDHHRNPEELRNPKKALERIFKKNRKRYVPEIHALQIIQSLPNFNRMRRISSFIRFAEKLTGLPASECIG